MLKLPAISFLLALLVADASAQAVSGSFSPNPAPIGVPVTFTGTEALGTGCNLPSPCGWYRIHQGSQSGPLVPLGQFCIQVIVPVGPNGTFAFTWNQHDSSGQQVPPGPYWFEVRTWDQGFQQLSINWFCISIQPAGAPSLTATGPARVGLQTPLQVHAPSEPGAIWVVACSLDCNNPIAIPGLDVCLSLPIFLEPFTTPLGVLDASGDSSGLELVVPNTPLALWQGLHVQSLVFGAAGLLVTNTLSFTVQP